MDDPNPFPAYEKPQPDGFPRQRVVEYLLGLSAHGYEVRSDGDNYVLPLEHGEVRITPVDGFWRVSRIHMRVLSTHGDASSEGELDQLVRRAFGVHGSWPERPQRGRLSAETPASNFRTISSLIGSAEVQAVFDPYLDNQGLEQLIRILSFGQGSVAGHVRLLATTTTSKSHGPGRPPRFTKAGVDAWATQLGVQADARILPQGNEHRRFVLLDGGQSLILGPSLNSLHKNEAVSVEDGRADRAFFDQQWAQAQP